MIIDLKIDNCYNDCEHVTIKEINLKRSQCNSFINKLSKLEISSWGENYYN